MKEKLFPLGQVVMTPAAMEVVDKVTIMASLLARHVTGDWGDLNAEDKRENDLSVKEGYRILSAYHVGGQKVWVITEADRSVTTILLPSDY